MKDDVLTTDNFKLIVEHAPIGIVIVDKDLQWRLTNKRFGEITGYTRNELKRKTFLDITYKDDLENNIQLYEEMISGKIDEYSYEKRYVKKSGQIIWVRLNVAGVRFDGEYSYMIALIQDIDENKRRQSDLEFRNKELDTLFYKVSHDLKAPVASLEGICEVLATEFKVNGNESFSHLEATVRKLKNQNKLLFQLTEISELAAVKVESSFSSIVQGVLDTKDSLVGIELDVRDDRIKTDPYLLSIAFNHLIDNSILYSQSVPKINVSLSNLGRLTQIEFRDNGPGIDKDIIDRIFDMFFKGSEQSLGSGLGLYIVKKSVEKLEGEIEVVSREGAGTLFRIRLPY